MSAKFAKKRFGQHFLYDPNTIATIISKIAPNKDDIMVEIGPGAGALTVPLIQHLDQLHAIEIDRDWAERLPGTLAINKAGTQDKLVLHTVDVLKFDFSTINQQEKSIRLVGNLPYNISTPIMFHLVKYNHLLKDMVFMFQKEVAERICAMPNCHEYGRLSVMMQYYFDPLIIMHLPPGAFRPPPKVDSAIVRFTPRVHNEAIVVSDLKFITTMAFNQRRKTIRNTLKKIISVDEMIELGVDPTLRPENLSLDDYVKITKYYSSKITKSS